MKKDKENYLSIKQADAILQRVYRECGVEPNSIPLEKIMEELESNDKIKSGKAEDKTEDKTADRELQSDRGFGKMKNRP